MKGARSIRLAPSTSQRALPASLAVVQVILAYEWLTSGLNKVINPNFTVQLASTLRDGLKGNPYGWYDAIVRSVIVPNATIFGFLVQVGETAIGVTLAIGAILWLVRRNSGVTRLVARLAAAALLASAFLSINYFLQGGTPLPWLNPGNAFNEGVDIDVLIPLIAVTLAVANIRASRAPGRKAELLIHRTHPWAA